jgi:hypothetical protein
MVILILNHTKNASSNWVSTTVSISSDDFIGVFSPIQVKCTFCAILIVMYAVPGLALEVDAKEPM